MADVTLVLKADNSQYVNSIKQAQAASQKLYDSAEKGMKREKGLIEDVEDALKKLQEAQRKAFTIEEIEKYNKKIAEAKQSLDEYNKAGVAVKKETDSLVASFGKWITSIGIVTTLMAKLKESFLDTRQGILLFNQAAAATSQVLYNIVNGIGDWNQGVAEAIILAKKKTELLRQDSLEMLKAKELMREYNKLYTEGIDATLTSQQRYDKLTEAKKKFTEATNIEIKSTKEQLKLAWDAWKLAPTSETAMKNFITLKGNLADLEGELDAGTRRLTRQITATEKQIQEDSLAMFEERWKLAQELLDRRAKAETDAEKAILDQQLKDQAHAMDLINKKRKEEAEKRKDLAKESGSFLLDMVRNQTADSEKIIGDSLDEVDKRIAKSSEDATKLVEEATNQLAEKRAENLAAAGEAVLSFIDILTELADKELEFAERQKDNFDTRISELQNELEIEAELYAKGRASNVESKKIELETLKKQRDKAILDEDAARKKQHTLMVASLLAQKAVDVAKIVSATAVANAQARILLSNPITAAIGISLLAANRVAAAISIASIVAAIAAASASKFARGGWTGNGFYRDETGERVAGTVHEREFVIRRGPAHKFRDVLEAINRDDRKMIFNKFNKLSPDLGGTTVNNVVVENNGPNKRLDQINRELRQLNKKQVKEEVMTSGNAVIIKKGDAMRIIKR